MPTTGGQVDSSMNRDIIARVPSSLKDLAYDMWPVYPFFWRFSLRRLADFPFFTYKCEDDLLDNVAAVLNGDRDLCRWLDHMAGHPAGHFASVAARKRNSLARRGLRYAQRLLASSVMRCDTGVRGGISALHRDRVHLPAVFPSEMLPLPASAHVIRISASVRSPTYIVRPSDDTLIIPVDVQPRVVVSASACREINSASAELLRHA